MLAVGGNLHFIALYLVRASLLEILLYSQLKRLPFQRNPFRLRLLCSLALYILTSQQSDGCYKRCL
jgi:hypothetical protein